MEAVSGQNLALRAEVERLKAMLEDVVSELDLSDGMIEKHGPLGTEPSVLVRAGHYRLKAETQETKQETEQ